MAEFVDQIPQQPGLAFEEKTHQYILNGTQVLPSVTTLMKPLSDTLYAGIRPETLQAAAERGTEVRRPVLEKKQGKVQLDLEVAFVAAHSADADGRIPYQDGVG